MDFDLPVARVHFADRTYVGAVVRSRGGYVEVLAPKTLEPQAAFQADAVYACGPCEDPNVLQRWQLTLEDGSHVVAEYTTGCGCSGMAVGAPVPEKLAW